MPDDRSNDAQQEQQWLTLYTDLRNLLGHAGVESAFGTSDFWLVDDNWGSLQQKVCVHNLSFLTPPLIAEVQQLLKARFPTWEVLFSLEVPGIDVGMSPTGVVVRSAEVQEHWNRERMRRQFGSKFLF